MSENEFDVRRILKIFPSLMKDAFAWSPSEEEFPMPIVPPLKVLPVITRDS